MATKFVFATNNPNKISEVKQILGEKINILSLEDINCDCLLPEDQDSLVGNALQKARYVYDNYKINSFSDDTGLEVSHLHDLPGVHSARYAGPEQDPAKNINKLLSELKEASNRNARFRTVIALVIEDKEYFFEGSINGTIANAPRGNKGFGYDPVFIPDGFDETFAEMPANIKNRISHRGIAFEKLKYFLRNYIY